MKKTKKRSWIVRVLRFIFVLHLWFWGVIAALCLLYTFINPPLTPLMLDRLIFRGYKIQKREFIKLKELPPRVVNMTLALEDPNFRSHFGFEWEMIKQAYARNKKAKEIRFGASTISNQLARTVFLTTRRNYFRKYLEVQVTLIMELLLTKNRMLELYFNYVEWGKGIYGIETAARYYYGKSAAYLSRNQSMKMVSILTNPLSFSPETYYNSASAYQRYSQLNRYF